MPYLISKLNKQLNFLIYDNILSGLTGDLNCDYCFDDLSRSYILVCPQLGFSVSESTFDQLQESTKSAINNLLYVLAFGQMKVEEFAAEHKVEIKNFPNYKCLNGKFKLPFITYNEFKSVDELEIDFYHK